MKFLIAEDEYDLQQSIATYLERDGNICEVASDYIEAAEKAAIYEYDVIVLDINLLTGSGLDVLKTNMRDGALLEVAQEAGKTEAQIALNWCISKENVVAIPMDDGTHIEENCGASGWCLAPEQVEFLEDARWP